MRLSFQTFLRFAGGLLCAWLLTTSAARPISLTFHPIYFDSQSSKLTEAGKEALGRVAEILRSNPDTNLRLEGHAGIEGDSDPQVLSEERAGSAKSFLLATGTPDSRLDILGRGSSQLQNNVNPAGGENRRVEFVFLEIEKPKKPSAANLETIHVIYWNTLYHALYPITYTQGFFEKEGFDVDLIATNHSTVNQVKAACGLEPFLKAGSKAFAGGVCGGSPHEAIANGTNLVVIGGLLMGGSMLIAKPEMAARLRADWNNFKGIRIGRPKGTVLTSMIVAQAAFMHGVDHRKFFKWHLFNSHEDVLEALAKGTIDAGDTYAPLNLQAKEKYGMVEVYNTFQLFPFHPCCRVITTPEKVAREREKYVRFLKALIRGHEFFVKFPLKAVEVVQKFTGYTKEEVRLTLTNPSFRLNPDPLKNGFVRFWKMMNETGFIDSKADINKYIDATIYRDALEQLLKEDPANPYLGYMKKQYMEQDM
jgi:NitT/TauT family transport system substrate-binding protein